MNEINFTKYSQRRNILRNILGLVLAFISQSFHYCVNLIHIIMINKKIYIGSSPRHTPCTECQPTHQSIADIMPIKISQKFFKDKFEVHLIQNFQNHPAEGGRRKILFIDNYCLSYVQ